MKEYTSVKLPTELEDRHVSPTALPRRVEKGPMPVPPGHTMQTSSYQQLNETTRYIMLPVDDYEDMKVRASTSPWALAMVGIAIGFMLGVFAGWMVR